MLERTTTSHIVAMNSENNPMKTLGCDFAREYFCPHADDRGVLDQSRCKIRNSTQTSGVALELAMQASNGSGVEVLTHADGDLRACLIHSPDSRGGGTRKYSIEKLMEMLLHV